MKRIFSISLCAIMMALCTTAVQAQNNGGSSRQRMTREQLAEAQAKHISHELALDDATSKKFIETYLDYQKEVWALGPRLSRRQQAETEDEAEQAIKQRMERSQKILDLREKYYQRYSQFLTQKQIQRVYELERRDMQRLARRGQGRASQRTSARHTTTRHHSRR